ncbi:YqaE/Pmp3 family membrane protein [Winogradskyella echinorum]|uniref:YqaE/Pmp3 family membrane protein n=1 Tax=Winogradskyella echinorum TaxID=538189 RepID=A0ABR6Y346_9FLAO|nr:YqaE/Pmp3 family membrane protein [Winogradskyella echinorum]MBC3847099.1 YqaE/Pmp3 family membrane protein [Winogradskyella echinorum]MBC5751447.1 YqaE/Pmp3 family membrane protein [Winogradskyella echinorum]
MSLLTIILSILLPPLAVFLKHGLKTEFLISVILTIIGWLPGVIYAFYVNSK